MKYDFDAVVDRRGTNSLKYDFALERGYPADALPLWVADTDFAAPPEVIRALHAVVDHGIFGYTDAKPEDIKPIQAWFAQRHGWTFQPEWMLFAPGVVFAVAAAINAVTQAGEGVLIQRPVYYPFANMIQRNDRRLVNNPLCYKNGRYEMDFADFERKITEENVKLFILCSPHNPVGRVWSKDELTRVGEICARHGVVVLSDEIHCDFTFPGYRHTMFPALGAAFEQNCILCTAPSKTFNLAGLQLANMIVPNPDLRQKVRRAVGATGYSHPGAFSLAGVRAAYQYGAQWLEELLAYLKGNVDFTREYLAAKLPQVKLVEPEGTYLLWLDFRALGLSKEALERLIVDRARLWLDSGAMFGPEGDGFERINIACPRSVLRQALGRLEEAVNSLAGR